MLMSKSAYARHRGVSRQTVYDWVKKGKVVIVSDKIDVEATELKRLEEEVMNGSEYLTLSVSQIIEWLHNYESKYPAIKNRNEARKFAETAANTIYHNIEFLSYNNNEEAVRIYSPPDDSEYFFRGPRHLENAIYFIRDFIYANCLNMKLCGVGDKIHSRWTFNELVALCAPLEIE